MIIGLTGFLGSGKDLACNLIREIVNEKYDDVVVIRDAFADRLKISAVRSIMGDIMDGQEAIAFANKIKNHGRIIVELPYSAMEGHLIDQTDDPDNVLETAVYWYPASGREYLQRYGTEGHRDVFDSDFWIDAVIPYYSRRGYGRQDCLEVDAAGKEPLLVITDVRFDNEAEAVMEAGGVIWKIDRPSANIGSTHASEIPVSDVLIDDTILNDGTIDEFKTRIGASLDRLLGRHPAGMAEAATAA